VAEEFPVTFAQIIEPFFTGGALDKPVFGTFSMAHGQYFTIQAIVWQRVEFSLSESHLHRVIQ
jgi:hypothetical protein